MKTIIPFKKWLTQQGLEGHLDKEKRKQVHAYYRKHIYLKEYSKLFTGNRSRSNVSFSSNDFLQVKAKSASMNIPIATFIKKATMSAVTGDMIAFSKNLTAILQLLGLCQSDIGFLIEREGLASKEMYQPLKDRLAEIEKTLSRLCQEKREEGTGHVTTPTPIYTT